MNFDENTSPSRARASMYGLTIPFALAMGLLLPACDNNESGTGLAAAASVASKQAPAEFCKDWLSVSKVEKTCGVSNVTRELSGIDWGSSYGCRLTFEVEGEKKDARVEVKIDRNLEHETARDDQGLALDQIEIGVNRLDYETPAVNYWRKAYTVRVETDETDYSTSLCSPDEMTELAKYIYPRTEQ